MNLYFLRLIEDSKKGRRETIIDGCLPNLNQDCIEVCSLYNGDDDINFCFWKNGFLKLEYNVFNHRIELKVGKDVFLVLQLHKNKKKIKGRFIFDDSHPLTFRFYSGKDLLESMKIDSMPIIRRRNWTKRILITFQFVFW